MVVNVTITNIKGGVGKTSLTVNLGGLLADLGQKVSRLSVVGLAHGDTGAQY